MYGNEPSTNGTDKSSMWNDGAKHGINKHSGNNLVLMTITMMMLMLLAVLLMILMMVTLKIVMTIMNVKILKMRI